MGTALLLQCCDVGSVVHIARADAVISAMSEDIEDKSERTSFVAQLGKIIIPPHYKSGENF